MQMEPTCLVVFPPLPVTHASAHGRRYGNWCYTYCVRYMGLSERTSQRISSCYWLFFTLARLPAMLLLRWVSVEAILAATMPLAIAGPCAAMLLRAQAGSTGAVALATAVSILVAVGAAAGMPCALSVATEYVHVDGKLGVPIRWEEGHAL